MKEFVFYTFEGYTESPTGQAVENIQILGFEFGENEIEARNHLIKENEWIIENGFRENRIIGRQIL